MRNNKARTNRYFLPNNEFITSLPKNFKDATHADLFDYINSRRQVGHTELLKKGIENYDEPFFILAHDMTYALNLAKSNKNAIAISLDNTRELFNRDYPIFVDNHVYIHLHGEHEKEITELIHHNTMQTDKIIDKYEDLIVSVDEEVEQGIKFEKWKLKREWDEIKEVKKDLPRRANKAIFEYGVFKTKLRKMSFSDRLLGFSWGISKVIGEAKEETEKNYPDIL